MQPNFLTREEAFKKIMQIPDPAKRAEAAKYALEVYGPAPKTSKFIPYQFVPASYIETFLKWTAWSGTDEKHPGQVEILDACALAVRQQIEKRDFERGEIQLQDLKSWKPGKVIKNWIRVESGNGIGKTKTLSGAVQWFFDCFESVVYTFSTSATQDELTTWAEIGQDRSGTGLPGTLLKTKIYLSPNRFAVSRSPSNSGGKGEENTKGKHKEFLLFVIDEADGAEKFIFDAIETMSSGGISVVLMTANPRSRATHFHRLKNLSYVDTLRISTLYHPNVVQNKELIPGAVKRSFVEKEIETGCEVVSEHNEEFFTFELPYDVQIGEKVLPAGTIFKPKDSFMTRILGIAPANSTDNTLIPVGVFEAACNRTEIVGDQTIARMGVDVARGGIDNGTLYIKCAGTIGRAAVFEKEDTNEYIRVIRKNALQLAELGVTSLHIRIDGGGGFGSGIIDSLKIDNELIKAFRDFKVYEVLFNATPYNKKKYKDLITEMMAETGESLKSLKIIDPPERLEADLCEREFEWRNVENREVKMLEQKKIFKKRKGHSPDDGDGFVMAAAPDFCFKIPVTTAPISVSKVSLWTVNGY